MQYLQIFEDFFFCFIKYVYFCHQTINAPN